MRFRRHIESEDSVIAMRKKTGREPDKLFVRYREGIIVVEGAAVKSTSMSRQSELREAASVPECVATDCVHSQAED